MSVVLEVRNVVKTFGESKIIRGLNLSVKEGERHAIIGPNGAGKSTMFNLISGYLSPTSGEILLRGRRIDGLPRHMVNRAGISRSFQITTIFPALSVFENLRIAVMARHKRRFPVFTRASTARRINDETDELLQRVRLTSVAGIMAGDLTYSEQRALEIGMALGPGGDVIMLDEPTAGMSQNEAVYIVELMREVTVGKTLIVIEHDMGVVFSIADRISVLVYGEIIATDQPDAIRSNRRVQEAYLGEDSHEPA
ncbi:MULTISPECIES: ABC transporter ATP-binding protein [unclassified Chelatococcus]|jgi:branched-chain amino acid transport system ATP-binding protein|uniref:ABC transporter ATP-binding protein n=1 Tax=unclassified Chelatococcus TaxID=2638111 RepID=UPI001BCFE82F|nr:MULTISPECIES: ABC transporter ATP-binding protein [unclassified Chelatococcus]CAH1654274.1 ABC transporter ATP-binding protein [Hyphomicrobiales bacterium]MBS7742803.1 ABC transporter ATP-binding protein [Chelatococcus sp. HY11]MBX3542079.1 ABC transporter ATP-binding protein [Chelatococcus sp.]MCO5074029.1 ABC transporter ATP-binding protein [Chelatococcus sp.]CAH1694844.1 ABC transporter ATP-binding protein [Hyphomicrobiales bacterium]